MADPHTFRSGLETAEAKIARLEAHLWHLWRQQNALEKKISDQDKAQKDEIAALKKDRAALLRRIGGWVVWLLVVGLSAIFSKGSTVGYLTQKLLEAMSGAL